MGAFWGVIVDPGTIDSTDGSRSLEVFVAGCRDSLERALVARFGVHDGMDAAAHALAYACREWDRLAAMTNPAGYLFRVGQSYGARARRRGSRHHHAGDLRQ